MQIATLFAGKLIAPIETRATMPRGFQDAITPRFQNILNIVSLLTGIGVVFYGFYTKWYLGIIAIVLMVVITGIIEKFLPDKFGFYINVMANDLANREADYIKSGDGKRAEASHFMWSKLTELAFDDELPTAKLPTMTDVNAME